MLDMNVENPSNSRQVLANVFFSFLFLLASISLSIGIMWFYTPEEALKISPVPESFRKLYTRNSSTSRKKERVNYISAEKFASFSQGANYFQPESAHERSQKLQQEEKGKIEGLLSEASKLVEQGNPQEALSILEAVLKIDPKNEAALVELGMINLIDFKSPHNALSYLQKALKINPDNTIVLSELLGIYDDLKPSNIGVSYLQTLYEDNPDNSSIAMGLGQILSAQNRLSEALPYLEKAADHAFENNQGGPVIAELADAYSQTGNKEKALETYQRVIDLEQEKFDSGFYERDLNEGRENLAIAYMDKIAEFVQQKKYHEAEELMEGKIKSIYPSSDINDLTRLFEQSKLAKRKGNGP